MTASPGMDPDASGVRLSEAGDAVRQDTHVDGSPRGPVRTCVGCRERADWSDLLRVVAGEVDGRPSVLPDPRHRLAGRGAWVHPDPACLALAERRRAFPRALRREGPLDTAPVSEHLTAGGSPAAGGGP